MDDRSSLAFPAGEVCGVKIGGGELPSISAVGESDGVKFKVAAVGASISELARGDLPGSAITIGKTDDPDHDSITEIDISNWDKGTIRECTARLTLLSATGAGDDCSEADLSKIWA